MVCPYTSANSPHTNYPTQFSPTTPPPSPPRSTLSPTQLPPLFHQILQKCSTFHKSQTPTRSLSTTHNPARHHYHTQATYRPIAPITHTRLFHTLNTLPTLMLLSPNQSPQFSQTPHTTHQHQSETDQAIIPTRTHMQRSTYALHTSKFHSFRVIILGLGCLNVMICSI
jgi:hypothetical protein